MNDAQTTVRLPLDLLDRLREQAWQHRTSTNALIVDILSDGVTRTERELESRLAAAIDGIKVAVAAEMSQ